MACGYRPVAVVQRAISPAKGHERCFLRGLSAQVLEKIDHNWRARELLENVGGDLGPTAAARSLIPQQACFEEIACSIM